MAATEFKPRESTTNFVFALANQKGGVGKSSITVLIGHYLSLKGYPIAIIDTDTQQSVAKIHKECIARHQGKEPVYNCYSYPKLESRETMVNFTEDVHYQTQCNYIIDTPGNLSQEGLEPVLLGASIIIVPFMYDEASVYSTMNFVRSLEEMCRQAGKHMPQVYFIPNRIQPKWGKKAEFKLWDKTDEWLCRYGKVTPRIPANPEVQRIDTFEYNRRQKEVVSPAFDFIINDYLKQTA